MRTFVVMAPAPLVLWKLWPLVQIEMANAYPPPRRRERRELRHMNEWESFNAQVIAKFRANGGKVAQFGDQPMVILHTIRARLGEDRERSGRSRWLSE